MARDRRWIKLPSNRLTAAQAAIQEAPLSRSHLFVASVAAAVAALTTAGCLETTVSGCQSTVGPHSYNFGDTANDSLTSQTCVQLYTVSVNAQENVRLTLTSPGVQTFVQLVDPVGKVQVNSALTAPVDTTTTVRMMLGVGNYTILILPLNSGQKAAYRLTSVTDTSAVAGCTGVWVTPGITTTQTITRQACTQGPGGGNYLYHMYMVFLQQGEGINFTEYSTNMAPQLLVVGPDGQLPSSPDSLGTTAVLSTSITNQGAYHLWVGSSTAAQTGSYTLNLQ